MILDESIWVVFGRVLDVFGGGSLCHGLVMCWNVTILKLTVAIWATIRKSSIHLVTSITKPIERQYLKSNYKITD